MRHSAPVHVNKSTQVLREAVDPYDASADIGPSTAGTEHTGIKEYLALAKRRWLLILGVVLLSTGYAINSVRTEKPRYQSRATVRLVDVSRALTGGMADRAGAADMPFSAGADPIQSQIQILQSEAVVSTAVDLRGLRLIPAEGNSFVPEIGDVSVSESAASGAVTLSFEPTSYTIQAGGATGSADYGAPAEAAGVRVTVLKRPSIETIGLQVITKESAMSHILQTFRVSNRPKTDILDLTFVSFEPNQTTRVANAMAEAYQLYNTTSAQQFSRRRKEFLEGQIRQTEAALAEANTSLISFRSGRQSSAAAAVAQINASAQVDAERVRLASEKQSLEALLSKARVPGQTYRALAASPVALTNPVTQQLFNQLAGFERARDDLINSGAAPTNPDLVATSSRIATTQARIVEAIESHLQSVSVRLEAANRERASGVSGAFQIPQGEAREAYLQQEVQNAQRLSGELKAELQKAQMAEAVEAGQVEIVQLARNPGSLVATGKERKLALGLLVGLMFGFGAAVFFDNLDKRIRRRGDIEPLLGVPGLVVIPRLPSGNAVGSAFRRLPGKGGRSASGGGDQTLDLVTVKDPRSVSAEAFRTLRTNLMYSQAVSKMRTLVVTSASPSEGKTVTAANLAVAFAQQGMRVLLIDCDLRKGRAHKVFGIPREPGMSDFILGYQSEEAVTHATSVPGLYVIPTGKIPPNPAEVLGGQATRERFAGLTEGYDLLIVDTPPLLAASDAAILATLSDGVIMVLRAGATESTAAQQAVQQLQSIGARVVGAVLNDPEAQVAKYGAYYEYNYSGADA